MSLTDILAWDVKKALKTACRLALDMPLGLLPPVLTACRAPEQKRGMQSAKVLISQQL